LIAPDNNISIDDEDDGNGIAWKHDWHHKEPHPQTQTHADADERGKRREKGRTQWEEDEMRIKKQRTTLNERKRVRRLIIINSSH